MNKNGNAIIRYFCCEDKIIVRVVEEQDSYADTLEYYSPKYEGWMPSKEWYDDMFVNKVVSFREITREEAINYIKTSIEYFKRLVVNPIYLRRIYGLNLEFFNTQTGKWQKVVNDDWYEKIDEYEKVSKEEVEQFTKKKMR